MIKKFTLILATVVAGFLGAVALASPASAAPTCCSNIIVTQAWADGHVDNQMQSCNEPVTEWNGACGSSGISSWKFWLS